MSSSLLGLVFFSTGFFAQAGFAAHAGFEAGRVDAGVLVAGEMSVGSLMTQTLGSSGELAEASVAETDEGSQKQ
jgi:hypothetical protein